MPTSERKGLHDPACYEESLARIERLQASSTPEWGTMSVAQMLAHCAEVQEVSNGEKELRNTPFVVKLLKGFIRKMVLSEKPYPKSTRTHPQYIQKTDKDFDSEKQRLLAGLESFRGMDAAAAERSVHPLFGQLTLEEKGYLTWKHLDHHLRQFGV